LSDRQKVCGRIFRHLVEKKKKVKGKEYEDGEREEKKCI
jgi:hypothetical protein